VQEVTEAGKQFDRACALAETIAKQAPLGVRATMLHARKAGAPEEQELARMLFADLGAVMASEDAREGMQSFVERREAKFTGK
jgi:enoyl-CoA hydratase